MAKEVTVPTTDELGLVDENDLILTTKDNPYNPHNEYDKWKSWDEENGYFTESFLARVADIPFDVDLNDDILVSKLTNDAVQEILEHDVLNIYKLV